MAHYISSPPPPDSSLDFPDSNLDFQSLLWPSVWLCATGPRESLEVGPKSLGQSQARVSGLSCDWVDSVSKWAEGRDWQVATG